jgi:transcriptional regulator with GAF, ATPase, and Fis domain
MKTMDNDSGALTNKVDEFLNLFKKGQEFTQELLNENEKLRLRLGRLEEIAKGAPGSHIAIPSVVKDRICVLEGENKDLLDKFRAVEAENKDFAKRYTEVEAENNNLANLYVASYQLHSTLDFNEAVGIITEIVINLIGAEEFSIMLLDESTKELSVVAAPGMAGGKRPAVKLGEGIIGKAAQSGEPFYREGDPKDIAGVDYTHPLVCVPLKINELVIGVIAVYKLLPHKQALNSMDYELFSMLAGHAATALYSSNMYSHSERKLNTIQSFLDLLKNQ